MISGNYQLVADPSWKDVTLQKVHLECDTSLGPVNITLFEIAELQGFLNVEIFVVDKTNNAGTDPITIFATPPDKIDGAPTTVINANGGTAKIEIFSANQWGAFEGVVNSSSTFQKIVLVDSTYGNDATAVVYNQSKPFQNVDAAIAAAAVGDLIVMNPGDYVSFVNVLQKALSYNVLKGATLFIFSASSVAANENYTFFGEGNIQLNTTMLLEDLFTGDIIIDCNTLTFNGFIYYDPATYYANQIFSTSNIKLKANRVVNNNPVLCAIYPGYVTLNVNFGTYTSAITAGTGDFWCFGAGTYTFPVNSYIHIDNATMNTSGSPSPFARINLGTINNNTFITGNYNYINSGGAVARPIFINPDSTVQNIFFNGIVKLTNASMIYDQGTAKIRIEGKVYATDTLGVANELVTVYALGESTYEILADTYINTDVNPVLKLTTNGGQVDVIDCEIVNTSVNVGIPATVEKVAAGATLRLKNAVIINPVTSISAPAPDAIQVYSAYANKPTINISSAFLATAIIVDPAINSSNF